MRLKTKHLVAVIALVSLVGCGGGGDGDEVATESPVVETPVEAPVVETPVEAPVVETPVEAPVVENNPTQDTEAAIAEAKAYLASQLRDPTSVLYQNLKVYRLQDDATVCGQYNAKNGFGGYTGFENFYYRAKDPDSIKLVTESDATGTYGLFINSATDTLIKAVCSDITSSEASLAGLQFQIAVFNYNKGIIP